MLHKWVLNHLLTYASLLKALEFVERIGLGVVES